MASRAQPFKDPWKEQRLFVSRVVAAAIVIVLLTALLIVRLVDLQVAGFQRFSELSRDNQVKIEPLAPTRGLIFDRNGFILAENVPTWQLVATPEQVGDLDATLADLELLELIEPGERPVLVDLVRSHRRFERVTLAHLNETQAARFAVRRHRFPGIDIQEGLIRYYPYGQAAAHAVGYVGSISSADLEVIERSNYAATSQIGKTGVERSYEDLLHGRVGYRQQVVNAQGRVLLDSAAEASGPSTASVQGGLETRWPEPGRHLVLSIDMTLQETAGKGLQGLRGAAVAIDPRNGDLLALVSSPSFDPNLFAGGLSRAEFVSLNTDIDKPLFNRALTGRYPPGSTVKPFLGLAALHHESVDPEHDVYCPGHYQLPGSSWRFREPARGGTHGDVDLHAAIVRSCDVYFYQLAVALGIDHMAAFMKGFGFGGRTGIDIAGEDAGLVPSPEWKRDQYSRREDQVWFPGDTVNTGIGQGYTQVTPLQLAHASAIMAASGRRFRPRLLIGTESPSNREVIYFDPLPEPGIADVDPEHWQAVHDSMLGVTAETRGTGYSAMLGASYPVAGKTGTAQAYSVAQEEKYDAETIDERLRDHGLFIAFAPADAPTIAVAVVVENNGGGSRTSAPIVRSILDTYFGSQEYVARQH